MRRWIPTLILVLICAGGFWYAAGHSFFQKKPEATKKLIPVQATDIQSLEVMTKDGDVKLNRNGNHWAMAHPTSVPVDEATADQWIQSLLATSRDKVVVKDAPDLSEYGLKPPQTTCIVTLKDGSSYELDLGIALPIAGYHYGKLQQDHTIYQLDDTNVQDLAKTALDFQDSRLLNLSLINVKQMHVTWKTTAWTLSRPDVKQDLSASKWQIGGTSIESTQGSDLVSQLLQLNTDQLIQPASQIEFNSPSFALDITSIKNDKTTTLHVIGMIDGDHVWMKQQGGKWAYAIPLKTVTDFIQKEQSAMKGK